jgi:Zn-dependent M16 (insulinase) family peptidase
LHSTNYSNKEKKETTLLKKNNPIEDLVGNEDEYLGPDPNKTMINVTNDLSNVHKKISQREIMEEITEKLMEKLQDTINQKLQDALKKVQDTTNKKLEKTKKQLNGLREDFNKHQSETKDTIQKYTK